MGYTDKMLLELSKMDSVNGMTFNIMTVVYAVSAFIFLLFLKRYFKPNTDPQ
jgi:hypothetical protein